MNYRIRSPPTRNINRKTEAADLKINPMDCSKIQTQIKEGGRNQLHGNPALKISGMLQSICNHLFIIIRKSHYKKLVSLFMDFFNSTITGLQTVVTAIGAGIGVWGVVNLLEGYGSDNRATRS